MAEWLRWYYLIYLLPAGAAVILFLLSGLETGGEDSDGADAGDVVDAGDAPEPDLEVGGEADGEDASPAGARQLLSLLGFGRAPMSIVLGSLMITWGVFGFGATEVLRPLLERPAAFAPPSLLVAVVGSILSTRVMVALLARLMPQPATSAISQGEIAGLAGKVIFPVSETLGRVHLRDRHGTLHSRSARIAPGTPALDRGTEVIVASIDPQGRYVTVEPLGFSVRKK